MAEFFLIAALLILANAAVSLWRVVKGPSRADRMMGAQLVGTAGVAMLILLWLADGGTGVLDVALLLSLLAAFAAVGFVKSAGAGGTGETGRAGGKGTR